MSEKLQQAHSYRMSGEYPQAESLYREVLQETPDCAEACSGLGHTLMNEGDFDACVGFLRRAVEAEPDNSQYLMDLAKFHTMLAEYAQAAPLFSNIVDLNADSRLVNEAKKQLSFI